MFGLGIGEVLIILVIAFLLFGPKQLPEVARQVGKAVKGFKETAEDLRKSVEPELNMIQQEVKMVEQDFQASIKDAEDQINAVTTDDILRVAQSYVTPARAAIVIVGDAEEVTAQIKPYSEVIELYDTEGKRKDTKQ